MVFGYPPGLDRRAILEHPKCGAINGCTITGEPTNFAAQLVPIECATNDICHVLPGVPSLDLLEDQLFRFQLPSTRAIDGRIYVVCRK